MTDTPARALLRRLVEAVAHYTDDHLRRAGGAGIPHDYLLGQTMADARALLAQPAPEGEGQTCPVCEVPTIPIGARCPQCNETFWTPEELRPIWVSRRSRAEPEGEDATGLSVICRDCGMLVAGEVAGNRVRWVECQSCKPPLSRAEAEAMVERVRLSAKEIEGIAASAFVRDQAHYIQSECAALVAALTGGPK